jgi:hypothetical protein
MGAAVAEATAAAATEAAATEAAATVEVGDSRDRERAESNEEATMSEMVLIRRDDGALERLKVGDANSPVCYRVVCSCKANLGVLAQFVDQGTGIRIIRCGRCDLVTVVHGESVLGVWPLASLPEKYQQKGLIVGV